MALAPLLVVMAGCNVENTPAPADLAGKLDSAVVDAAVPLDLAPVADLSLPEPDCGSPFVYLKNKQFRLGNQPFVPVSVNYGFDIRYDSTHRDAGTGGYFIAPLGSFCEGWCCNDESSCLAAAHDQLEQIKNMGLNSLRIVGLGVVPKANKLVVDCGLQWDTWVDYCPAEAMLDVSDPDDLAIVMKLIADAMALVHEYNLKVVLMAGHGALDAVAVPAGSGTPAAGPIRDQYASYLTALATRFADEPTIFAYDLTNEPVYEFQDKNIDKVSANGIFRAWYDAVRAGTAKQMVTAGLAEIGTVRHWDPGSLPLDFTSFHIYSGWTDADRDYLSIFYGWVGRESYPNLIGETGLSVSGSMQEFDQQAYAQFALDTSWACGSLGLQWWIYRDTIWGPNDYFGLVRRNGTERPAAQAFASFTPTWPRPACILPAYEGSFPSGDYYHTVGRLIHDDGTPVGNGLVRGHKAGIGEWEWTISKADGTFDLHSILPVYEMEITAAGLSLETPSPGWPDVNSIQHAGDVTLHTLTSLKMAISTPSSCP